MRDALSVAPIRTTKLPGGQTVPVLGQGTWRMGEDTSKLPSEVAALRLGIELGMTLIDTAEMYASGGAEKVVGEAIAGRRDQVFVVTKFYPQNATRERMAAACDRSLRRLDVEQIDLYLLHWRGDVPLKETLAGFEDLLEAQKIRHAGVSNFDVEDMEELARMIRADGVIAIPKAADPKHVRENRGAADIKLTKRDLDELDESFPAPEGRKPLESR